MAIAPASPVTPGELVADKYLVEHVLGAGAMGVVVAATHVDLGQRVAIKFLASNAPSHVERFVREARATVRLRSEHAARVFDVGTIANGTPFMVLELLEGHDLERVIQEEAPLPIARAADYVIQICEAVAEAHALGIVHRDLKPQNLFLTRGVAGEVVVKVLDFGIAKSIEVEGANALTQTSSLMGSPLYMSPETMRSGKNVAPQNDLWALGVVLQELLTKRLPFEGDTFPELCLKVVHEQARSPLEDRPDLPPALCAVIARCLAKDPSERIQTAAELATALEPFAPPESRFVAERARQLAAQAAKGLIRTSPTLPSIVSTVPSPRDVTPGSAFPLRSSPGLASVVPAPVPSPLPALGPLPPLGEATIGLAATTTPQVLDSPSVGAPPAAGNPGPWILGSVAVVCLTVVIGGGLVLANRDRRGPAIPSVPPSAVATAANVAVPLGPSPSSPASVAASASAAVAPPAAATTTSPPAAQTTPAVHPAVVGPGAAKSAKPPATKPPGPSSAPPGDDIPNLR